MVYIYINPVFSPSTGSKARVSSVLRVQSVDESPYEITEASKCVDVPPVIVDK